jgi:Thioredoxin
MYSTLLFLSLAACPAPVGPVVMRPAHVAVDSTLLMIFSKGQTFTEFVAQAKARREGWLRLQRDAVVKADLLARARAVGGTWQLLVIARDGCGDSMNSVPYAARLADSVPGLTLRIVSPFDGQAAANTHRTADGRTATPTFILLDAAGDEAGCLVELPAPLRQWTNNARSKVSDDSLHTYRNTFYAKDAGVSVSTELVELLESARTGTPRCDRQTAK